MEHKKEDNREKIYIQVEAPYKLKYEGLMEFNDSFFHDAYTNAARIVRNIVEKNQEFEPNNRGTVYRNTEQIYNIVSFCGGRGAGKSSSMLSFMEYMKDYHRLKKENGVDQKYWLSEDGRSLLFVGMDCVDAGLLEEGEEIIEIILAKMLDKVTELEKHKTWPLNSGEHKRRDFHNSLKKMYDSLQNLRKKQGDNKKYWEDDDASLERLGKLAASINLRRNFKELVSDFLALAQFYMLDETVRDKSYIVISIDDIDMNLGKGYRMLEQIRRYLMVPQVIVLMSYDYIQLKSICDLYYSEELKGLGYTYKLSDEEFQKKVRHLTKSYMEKVVPVGTHVILPSLVQGDSMYHRKISLIPVGCKKEDHWSIRQTFQWKAAKCFAIYSCFDQSKSGFWDTYSLRILNNLYFQLHSMEENVSKEPPEARDLVKSRLLFRNNYRWLLDYINQKANLILTEKKMSIFHQIYQSNLEGKIPLLAELTKDQSAYLTYHKKLNVCNNPYYLLYWSLKLWEQDEEMRSILEMYFSAVIGRAILCEEKKTTIKGLLGKDGFGNLDYEISDKMKYISGMNDISMMVYPWRIRGICTTEDAGNDKDPNNGSLPFVLTKLDNREEKGRVRALIFFLMFINIDAPKQIQMNAAEADGKDQAVLNIYFPLKNKRNLSISNLFWNAMYYEGFFPCILDAFESTLQDGTLGECTKNAILSIKEEVRGLLEDFRQWEKDNGSSDMLQLQNVEFLVKLIDQLRESRTDSGKILNKDHTREDLEHIFGVMNQWFQEQDQAYQDCRRKNESEEQLVIKKPYNIFKGSPWMCFWKDERNRIEFSEMYVQYFRRLYERSEEYRENSDKPSLIEERY